MATRFDDWEGDFLAHYGVLDRNDFHTERNNKFASKWEKKAQKFDAKASKFEKRAKRSEELDRREQEYAQRVRTSGNIAMRLLTSTIGGKAYQQHLAMNKDTTSRGSKVTASILNYVAGRPGSMIRKAMYLRQDERAAKRAAKGKAADRGAAFRERAAAAKAAFESTVNKADNYVRDEYNEQRRKRQNRG